MYSLISASRGDAGSVILAGRFLAGNDGSHIAILRKIDRYDPAILGMKDLDDNVRFLGLSIKIGARPGSTADQAAAAKGIPWWIFAVTLQILQHLGGHFSGWSCPLLSCRLVFSATRSVLRL